MGKISDPIILLIDSDPIDATSTRAVLESKNYQVFIATDRESALSAASRLELDLVICDTLIRRDDGISIAEEIREVPNREDVPVMFVSNRQLPDVIRRTHAFGAAFHLKKPIKPQVLVELVENSLWMPHLVHNHVQSSIRKPHAKFPSANPSASQSQIQNSPASFL